MEHVDNIFFWQGQRKTKNIEVDNEKTRSIKKENRKLNDGIGSADKEEQNVILRKRLWLAQGDGFQKVLIHLVRRNDYPLKWATNSKETWKKSLFTAKWGKQQNNLTTTSLSLLVLSMLLKTDWKTYEFRTGIKKMCSRR